MGLLSKLFEKKNQNPNNDTSNLPDFDFSTYKTAPPEPIVNADPPPESDPSEIAEIEFAEGDARLLYEHSGVAKTYKLISSGTIAIQQNISVDLTDKDATITKDQSSGRYRVTANGVLIGYLSKSAVKTFAELFEGNNYLSFVDSLDTDAKGNLIPKVSVFIPGSPFVNRQHDWEPTSIPSSRPDYSHRITPVGITFGCKKSFLRSRQSVLRKLKLGDLVDIERYTYNGKAAYLFVDKKTGLDFGVIPASEAEYITNTWKIKRFEAYVIYVGTRESYDPDSENRVTQYYCDVYVYFYKK